MAREEPSALNVRGALKWWLFSALTLSIFIIVVAAISIMLESSPDYIDSPGGPANPPVSIVEITVVVTGLVSAIATLVTAVTGFLVLFRKGPKGRHSR